MDARFDKPFFSRGGFSDKVDGEAIHGSIRYEPGKQIELDLVDNLKATSSINGMAPPSIDTIYGRLVDGTCVTLHKCRVRSTAIQFGIGIGSPTTIVAGRALFGRHVANLDQFRFKTYTIEFSSLTNWTCKSPLVLKQLNDEAGFAGFDLTCRSPSLFNVKLPHLDFDFLVDAVMSSSCEASTVTIAWYAPITIKAHDSISLERAIQIAWQCHQLMSLLIGYPLSIRSITIETDPIAANDPNQPMQYIYQQVGKYDHRDHHAATMLLPLDHIEDKFTGYVQHWFARPEPIVLANNILSGAQNLDSPTINVRFLSILQAVESYHRALGSGRYIEQDVYDLEIQKLIAHIPEVIEDDHRHSLKNRLKYGNEYSLRKRLAVMFARLPVNMQKLITDNVSAFVTKVVNTRNYYTHYDDASKVNTFDGMQAFLACERVRILLISNMLIDLGINGDDLHDAILRNEDLYFAVSQPLTISTNVNS